MVKRTTVPCFWSLLVWQAPSHSANRVEGCMPEVFVGKGVFMIKNKRQGRGLCGRVVLDGVVSVAFGCQSRFETIDSPPFSRPS